MELTPDLKVLVVDDEPLVRRQNQMMLSAFYGVTNVVEAENGAEALEILENDPDIGLVISDWDMPEVDGLDLFEQMRAKSDPRPFILSTGGNSAREGEAKNAFQASGNAVFTEKPMNKTLMQEAAEKVTLSLGMSDPST